MTARSEQLTSLALAIVLAIGAGVIWGVIVGFSFSTISAIVFSHDVNEQLTFLHDGTPVIQSYLGADYTARTYRTLEGKPVDVEDIDLRCGDFLSGPQDTRKRFADLTWERRIAPLRDDYYGRENWYFIHDGQLRGHAYFVSYDKAAKARTGYMGRNGFRPDEPPLEDQFSINGRRMSKSGFPAAILNLYNGSNDVRGKCLLADDGLWRIDMKKRSVAVLRKDSTSVSAVMSYKPRTNLKLDGGIATILLRTPDRVLVLDMDGKEIEAYRLPAELRDSDLQWIPLPDGKALVQTTQPETELFWINTAAVSCDANTSSCRSHTSNGRP